MVYKRRLVRRFLQRCSYSLLKEQSRSRPSLTDSSHSTYLELQFVQGEFASVQISKKVLQGGFHGHKGNVIPRNVIFAE